MEDQAAPPGSIRVSVRERAFLVESAGAFAWAEVAAGVRAANAIAAADLLLKPGSRLLDIGAGLGATTLFAAASGATVTAYEPDPLALAALERTLSLNPELRARVSLIGAAVGDRDGAIQLRPGDPSSVEPARDSPPTGGRCVVPLIDARPVIVDGGWLTDPNALVRIDAGGSEYGILRTLGQRLATARCSFLIAFHPIYLPRDDGSPVLLARTAETLAWMGALWGYPWYVPEDGRFAPAGRERLLMEHAVGAAAPPLLATRAHGIEVAASNSDQEVAGNGMDKSPGKPPKSRSSHGSWMSPIPADDTGNGWIGYGGDDSQDRDDDICGRTVPKFRADGAAGALHVSAAIEGKPFLGNVTPNLARRWTWWSTLDGDGQTERPPTGTTRHGKGPSIGSESGGSRTGAVVAEPNALRTWVSGPGMARFDGPGFDADGLIGPTTDLVIRLARSCDAICVHGRFPKPSQPQGTTVEVAVMGEPEMTTRTVVSDGPFRLELPGPFEPDQNYRVAIRVSPAGDAIGRAGETRSTRFQLVQILLSPTVPYRVGRDGVVLTTVLLSHERPDLLAVTLESYLRTVSVPFELFVVDCASGPAARGVILGFAAQDERVVPILLRDNVGGLAINEGIDRARGAYVHVSENDLEYLPGWDRTLLAKLETFPGLGQVALSGVAHQEAFPWTMDGLTVFVTRRNTTTPGIMPRTLYETGVRWKTRGNATVRHPADGAFSHDVRHAGFVTAWNDVDLVVNHGFDPNEFARRPDYYVANYAMKPAAEGGIAFVEAHLRAAGHRLVQSASGEWIAEPLADR